ncbi:MAG: sigma 54-interacting transcriptional regulator [Bacteroidales bacterium]|nr:sigma 54-interacting transcriptional regulator [Bacteroidales bacterium]
MGKKALQEHHAIIEKSHERSERFGIDTNIIFPRKVAVIDELYEKLERSHDLIEIAAPLITELRDVIEGSGYFIILTDNEGCILKILGDNQIMQEAERMRIIPGAYMSEKSIGTNAMGTALIEDKPIQVTATEHFLSAFESWTCSAATIHNTGGEIIGTINLTGESFKVHLHTLGLVVATVKAIENEIRNREMQKQLYDSNMYAFAMMNNLAYGVIAVDMSDDIHWVNNSACDTLNIRRLELLDKPISQFVNGWSKLKKRVLTEHPVQDEEISMGLQTTAQYIINLYPINTPQNQILGYLLTFRPLSRMLKALNKYIGQQARYTFADIIGNSKKIKETVKYARTVAGSTTSILIAGESGTGKELFAQSIHNASDRRDEAFVALNCGAISPTLIESELFGYSEGAFTGAKKGGNPGKFELADKGTLFLDEIGEMSVDMQVRLLRVLQENCVSRIGSSKNIPIDVRIIAATNKNLEEEIKAGRFRLDLYYRLNVITITIPPLRERTEDILPLLRYFIKHKATKLQMPVPEIAIDLIGQIMAYQWPGNTRELENFAEKLVILGGNLTPNQMDREFRELSEPHGAEGHPAQPSISASAPLLRTLDDLEKEAILTTLEALSHNMSTAAKTLGISRNTLYQKLKKYNISF